MHYFVIGKVQLGHSGQEEVELCECRKLGNFVVRDTEPRQFWHEFIDQLQQCRDKRRIVEVDRDVCVG